MFEGEDLGYGCNDRIDDVLEKGQVNTAIDGYLRCSLYSKTDTHVFGT